MSNSVEFRLDVLASSPEEINQIEPAFPIEAEDR
jgi:hypothetical protein